MSAPSIKSRHIFLFLAVQTLLVSIPLSTAFGPSGVPFSHPIYQNPGNQIGLNPQQQAQVAAARHFEQMRLAEQQEKANKKS